MEKIINEVNLSRVWKHANNKDVVFTILTSDRDGLSEKELKQRRIELEKEIRVKGLGFFKLEGHWIENKGKENEVKVSEKSFFIVSDKKQENELLGFIRKVLKKYNQDGAIFKKADSDDILIVNNDRTSFSIGKFKPNKISDNYSKLKNGRTFVFESLSNANEFTFISALKNARNKKLIKDSEQYL